MRYVSGLLLLITLSVALVACQPAAPARAPNPVQDLGGVQVHEGGESVSISTGSGESLTISAQVPQEVKDFPAPPGFALTSEGFGSMTTRDGTLATGTWVGSPSVAEAADFYTRSMPLQGWTESMSMGSDTGRILTYEKGDHSAVLTIDQDGSTTRIALLYGTQTNRPTPTTMPFAEPTATIRVANRPAATAEPTETEAVTAPALTDASAMPAELQVIPSPAGFGVIKGSTQRMAEGGQFRMATARLFGTASVQQAASSYKQALASQWDLDADNATEDAHELTYTSKTDSGLALSIDIEKVDAGTEITLLLLSTN